jgi:hypothetical protein
MEVNLNHKQLKILVSGTTPNYYSSIGSELANLDLGHVRGGFDEGWVWNTEALDKLSEKELFDLHLMCLNSWN